jgi:hypothetical protein
MLLPLGLNSNAILLPVGIEEASEVTAIDMLVRVCPTNNVFGVVETTLDMKVDASYIAGIITAFVDTIVDTEDIVV